MRGALLGTIIGLVIASIGCGGSSSSNTTAAPVLTAVQVTAQSTNITVGQTEQLTAMGTYSDHTSKDVTTAVIWSSSNDSIATVSTAGVLTATSNGTIAITASLSSVNGLLNFTINPKLLSITVSTSLSSIAKSTKAQFTATGTFSDNSQKNMTSTVTWSSSKPDVATISSTIPTSGLAIGIAQGATTITATSGSVSGTAQLNVTGATATSLNITPVSPNLPLDVTQQLAATATFSDLTTQDVTNVATWRSQFPNIVSITASGLVTAKNLGTSNISASFESATPGTTAVAVNASDLSAITIQPADPTIAKGTKILFTAVGTFTDGSTHNLTPQVNWASSASSVTFPGGGNVASAAAPGPVTISATLGPVSGSTQLNVSDVTISSIVITPSPLSIPFNWHQALTAEGTFSDLSTQDLTSTVTWSSDNTSIASVGNSGSTTGVVIGGSTSGTANISAAFSSASASVPVTVTSSTTLTGISVTPTSSLVAPGASLQLDGKGKWSDGTSENINSQATWSSSNSQIAAVNTGGLVTGESEGIATITATFGSFSTSSAVAVEGNSLTGIQITPQSSSVPEAIETTFTATGDFSDGSALDLTSAATWTSSSPSVATISNAPNSFGVATGIAPGNTNITAVFAGFSASASLTVTNATLVSISISPSSVSLGQAGKQQFTAMGNFNQGQASINITNQVVWSSTNANAATINSQGLATATNASGQTTTIQATLNGVSGTATLSVQ